MPDTREHEILGTPLWHLAEIERDGESAGDCDDAAVLGGALARSVGMRVRVILGSFLPDRRLHHAWSEAETQLGWYELDPFRSERLRGTATRIVPIEV